MKKFLSFFMMLMLSVGMFAATETTVYYTAPESYIGTYTVKLNINRQGDADNWQQYVMTKTELSYNGDPIYTYTYTDLYDGVGAMQFQLYDGDQWQSQDQPYTSWTGVATYNGKMYVHATAEWVAAPTAEQGCDWANIAFAGNGSGNAAYTDRFKVCLPDGVSLVNIQSSFGTEAGFYVTFPSAAFGTISLAEGQYATQGGGMLLYVSAFLYDAEKEVTVVCENVEYKITVKNATPEVAPLTYTVAGNSVAAFAAEWNPALAANDMTEQEDGSYKWERTGLILPRGTIKFKVCESHAWDVAYPASDYELAIAEDGIYTITITFNPSAEENKVNAVATKTGDVEVIHTAAIKGSWDEWAAAHDLVLAQDMQSASITMTINNPATYTFKMIIDGDSWRSNGYEYHRGFVGVAGITMNMDGEDGNMQLVADIAGDYIFTWTFANDSLGIEFPEETPEPQGCDWANIAFAGNGSGNAAYTDRFKVCLPDGVSLVNIQSSFGTEAGFYVTFPSAAFGTISLAEGQYATQGGGMLLYVSAFLYDAEKEVTVVCENVEYKITVKNATPEVAPLTYTVAGNSVAAFAAEWNPALAANDMTEQEDGSYKWERTGLILPRGTIKFKVCESHAWDVAYPASDYELAIAEDGIYTITITFNPSAEENKVNAVATKTGDVEVIHTAAIKGSWDEWAAAHDLVLAQDMQSASITMTINNPATYTFKMIIDGDSWRSNGYEYHRGFTGAAGITMNMDGEDGDMQLVADIAGDYIFTWTFENDSLGIEFPTMDLNLENGYYLVGKFGGVDAWSVTDLSAAKLFVANPETEGEYSLAVTLAEGDELKVVAVENNAIVAWYPAEGDNYIIDDHHNGSTSIYFRPDYQGGEKWFQNCLYVVPTSTVGIDHTDAEGAAVKFILNGQLFIEKAGKRYNAQGAVVK